MLVWTVNWDSKEKNLSMCCLQTAKNYFMSCSHVKLHIHVLNTFTKKDIRQNMLCFRRDSVLSNKIATTTKKHMLPRPQMRFYLGDTSEITKGVIKICHFTPQFLINWWESWNGHWFDPWQHVYIKTSTTYLSVYDQNCNTLDPVHDLSHNWI